MQSLILVGLILAALAASYIPYILLVRHRPRAAHMREKCALAVMTLSASLAVCALILFFAAIAASVIEFFQAVSWKEFFFGTVWDIGATVMTGEFTGTFGALGLFWGTGYIALLAMCAAWGIGYPAAVYAAQSSPRVQNIVKSFCQILVAVPSIVWGLLAVLIIAPSIRGIFTGAAGNTALTAGIAMGLMLMPWVTFLVLTGLQQVPKAQWEAGYALGLDTRKTVGFVVRPQARSLIWAALISTGSKAVTETMVVLLAAGLRAQISLNPLDEMTTATVHIASLMTGDIAFDHPAVLASFALLSVLVSISIIANSWLAHVRTKQENGSARSSCSLARWVPGSADDARTSLWRIRNTICCAFVVSVPLLFVGMLAWKAWPALWITEIKVVCNGAPVSAGEALAKQLDINSSRLSRSEGREFGRLLYDRDEVVRCGDAVQAGDLIDEWFKGETRWLSTSTRDAPRWAEALRPSLELRLHLAPFYTGDGTYPGIAGMGQALWGTILAILIIVTIVAPIAVLAAVMLHFYLHAWNAYGQWIANRIESASNALLSFPVIAFGILGNAVFVKAFGLPTGSGWVVALTLGIIALPYIILTTLAAITATPHKKQSSDGGLALGLTKFETVWKIILPQSAPAILAGAVFGIVHAVGETAALLPIGAKGFMANIDLNPLAPTTTLSMQVYIWATMPQPGFHNLAALAALVLLCLCLLLSSVALSISHRHERAIKAHRIELKPLKPHHPWRFRFRQ